MKYIKLFDSIYELDSETEAELILKSSFRSTRRILKEPQKYYNFVDSIEELINRYIVVNKGHYKIYARYEFENKTRNEVIEMIHKGIQVYGCIWVTLQNKAPRLEPVAQINLKGELELL